MINKQKLQELLNKLDFLIQIDEDSINISEIEKLLGALIPFTVSCEQAYDNNKLIWLYIIHSPGPGTSSYNRLHALRNEIKYYLG